MAKSQTRKLIQQNHVLNAMAEALIEEAVDPTADHRRAAVQQAVVDRIRDELRDPTTQLVEAETMEVAQPILGEAVLTYQRTVLRNKRRNDKRRADCRMVNVESDRICRAAKNDPRLRAQMLALIGAAAADDDDEDESEEDTNTGDDEEHPMGPDDPNLDPGNDDPYDGGAGHGIVA